MDTKIEPITAPKKPVTVKPGTINATIENIIPFIMNVKRPRLSIFMGSESIIRTGFMNILNTENINAAKKAVNTPDI